MLVEQAPGWLARWIDDRVRAGSAMRAVVPSVRDEAMYLYGSIGIETALTSTGEVWVGEYEIDTFVSATESITWRRADGAERVGYIVIGARRYPELRDLLPVRPREAGPCPDCRATGDWHVFSADRKESLRIRGMICHSCGGLGWQAVSARRSTPIS